MTGRTTRTRRLVVGGAWLATLLTAAAAVASSGRTLPFPAPAGPADLVLWAAAVGPATATFTMLRAVAMVLLAWLVLSSVASIAVRAVRRPRAVRAVDRWSPRVVRRAADLVAGATVVVASLAPTTGAGAAAAPRAAVVMQDLGPVPSGPVTDAPASPPTLRAAEPVPVAPTAAAEPGRTWVIGPGDTLWHVAEQEAADDLGRPATARETADRLDRLVALNADRLAVPGDADLVFPGQEFLLP